MNYLLKSGNYLKIGYASNFKKRLFAYNTHNPDVEVIDTFDSGTLETETMMHRQLKPYKHRGEWYEFNPEILKVWNAVTQHFVEEKVELPIQVSNQVSDLEEILTMLKSQYSIVITDVGIHKLSMIENLEVIKLFLYLLQESRHRVVTYNDNLRYHLRTKIKLHVSNLSSYFLNLQELNLVLMNKSEILINPDCVKI